MNSKENEINMRYIRDYTLLHKEELVLTLIKKMIQNNNTKA